MMSNTETWNDGQLRSVQLITNGFPDDDEPALPDELFLSNLEGERLVEFVHEPRPVVLAIQEYWDVDRVECFRSF